VKTIVLVVEDSVLPARVTDHEVPDGRPLSVKVTSYVAAGVPAGPKRIPESTRATTMRTMTTTAPIAIHTFLDIIGFPGGEGGEVVEDGALPGGVLELDIRVAETGHSVPPDKGIGGPSAPGRVRANPVSHGRSASEVLPMSRDVVPGSRPRAPGSSGRTRRTARLRGGPARLAHGRRSCRGTRRWSARPAMKALT
jgi:hypothetical protein